MACVPAKDLLSLGQWHLLPVLVGTGDRSEGLQLSCLPRGCPAHPAGASVIDGLCLTWALDAASKEWREKAKKDLEEWNLRQNEQMEKNRANNRASEEAFLKESKEETPGSEWEKVAQLCDFNPKSSKQSKDVSRMRSVLISLKQTPLSR
uniref:Clathrin light chain n=1 Tax=Zosterops lateralis melanops TaxID=1220523 RepID=A0A8D2NZR5_ZOSLA